MTPRAAQFTLKLDGAVRNAERLRESFGQVMQHGVGLLRRNEHKDQSFRRIVPTSSVASASVL